MFKHRIPLAWRNITESKLRLLTSLAGIAFAVVLIFMENGFRTSLIDSMVKLPRQFDADLVMMSRARYILSVHESFPRERLNQALSFSDVTAAYPVYVEDQFAKWKNPETGISKKIRVIAFRPEDPVFRNEEIEKQAPLLQRPDTVLGDAKSKKIFYGDFSKLPTSDLQGRQVKVVGTYQLGADFQNNGTVITSEDNFLRMFPERAASSWEGTQIDLGILKVKPGTDLLKLQKQIDDALPDDVEVLTRDQFIAKERAFWEKVTPVGIVFTIGMVMGFAVGLMICYQILFSDISDRLAEFATLKAIGYSNRRLFAIILEESVLLALMGFVVGVGVSTLLYWYVAHLTGLPLVMSLSGGSLVLVLTVIMCAASGFLAARKLVSADPAELFK